MSFEHVSSWLDVQREETEETVEDTPAEDESDDGRPDLWASIDASQRPSQSDVDLPSADTAANQTADD